jgi:hypothetical protein
VLSTLDECEAHAAEEPEQSVGQQNSTLPCATAPSGATMTNCPAWPQHPQTSGRCFVPGHSFGSDDEAEEPPAVAVQTLTLRRRQVTTITWSVTLSMVSS